MRRRGHFETIAPPPLAALSSTQRRLPAVCERTMRSRVLLPSPLIAAVDDFLTPEECTAWINFGEALGFAELDAARSAGYALRRNGRIALDDEDIAACIFERIKAFVPRELGCNSKPVACASNLRLYRYMPGQSFGKHVDESNEHAASGGATEFTLLVYLNGGDGGGRGAGGAAVADLEVALPLEGGATIFYLENDGGGGATAQQEVARPRKSKGRKKRKAAAAAAVAEQRSVCVLPQRGTALIHRHGDECLEHEGQLVTTGVKYLLRTDVVYAR